MPTILIADDEQAFRSLLSEALKGAGYSVLISTNGQEALALATAHPEEIPLLVTDFSMPGISGIELLRELRKSRPAIKAILLTGHWIHPLPEELDVVYLMKPCAISKFLGAVKELVATVENNR